VKLSVRIFSIVLCVFTLLSVSGCGLFSSDMDKLDEACEKTVNSLFAALNSDDADAVYELFAHAVQESDAELKDNITKLLAAYKGPSDEIDWKDSFGGGWNRDDGEKIFTARGWFPVRAGDTYYWFSLGFTYKNTVDKSQIGINSLILYTEDERYITLRDEEGIPVDFAGIKVYAERKADCDVKCVNGSAYGFVNDTSPLDLGDVKDFLNNSNEFEAFKDRFGNPNASGDLYCYKASGNDTKQRYLLISESDGIIQSVKLCDDFNLIEEVYDSDDVAE